jgi:PAS domain S-box-containing protein
LPIKNTGNSPVQNSGGVVDVLKLNKLYKKYRLLFENLVVGVGIADFHGNIIEANEAMCKITGYPRKELLKVKLQDTYFNPKDRKKLIELIKKYGVVNNFEVKLKNGQGKPYWASLSIKKITLDDKDYLLTCETDITALRRLGATNITAETVEAMGAGVILHQPGGKIILVNPSYEKMTGYGNNELTGTNVFDFLGKIMKHEDQIKTEEAVKTALEKKAPHSIRVTIVAKNGQETPVIQTVSLIKSVENKHATVVAVLRDITELKCAEDEIKTKIKELQEFHDLVVARELKMKQMEEELNQLKAKIREKK